MQDGDTSQTLLALVLIAFMVVAGVAAFVDGAGCVKVLGLQGGGGGSDPSFIDNTYENFRQGTSENVEVRWMDYTNNDRLYSEGDVRLAVKEGLYSGQWVAKDNAPATYGGASGQGKTVTGAGENVYYMERAGTGEYFYRYNPTAGWQALKKPSEDGLNNPRTGVALAWDNGDYIYSMRGGGGSDYFMEFRRYKISDDDWESLEDTPWYQGAGDAMVWVDNNYLGGEDEYIYAVIGSTSSGVDSGRRGMLLACFNITAWNADPDSSPSKWENLYWKDGYGSSGSTGAIPYGCDDGSNLAWLGDNYLYYLVGAYNEGMTGPNESHFIRYNMGDNTWAELASVPYNNSSTDSDGVDDGGSLAWLGDNNYLYALKGGNGAGDDYSDNFYRFSINNNAWENMPWVLESVGNGYAGNRMAGANGKIYYYRAYPTTGFWVFDPRYYTQGQYTSQAFYAGSTAADWDNISWDNVCPSITVRENDNVGAEPTTFVDGENTQIGTLAGGTIANTCTQDGYESINEQDISTPITQSDDKYATTSGASDGFANYTNVEDAPDDTYSVGTGVSGLVDHVVISELFYDETSTDAHEFIELYNPTGSAIDISGWKLQEYEGGSPGSLDHTKTIPPSQVIPAWGYYLLGQTSPLDSADFGGASVIPDADPTGARATMSWVQDMEQGPDAYRLLTNGDVYVDGISYGSQDQGWEDSGYYTDVGASDSIERKSASTHDDSDGNGYDTNVNGDDLRTRGTPQPQNSDTSEHPGGIAEGDNVWADGFATGSGTITAVELKIEYKVSAAWTDDDLIIKYSLDSGATFGATSSSFTPTSTTDTTATVDVTSDRSWSWTDITNLRIYCTYNIDGTSDGKDVSIDAMWVKVTYSVSTPEFYLDWQHTIDNVRPGIDVGGDIDAESKAVGYWHLNEGSDGTTADASGNGNTGTIVNATWTTSGWSDNALSFDDSGDYVEMPEDDDDFDLTTAITVEAWVNVTELPSNQEWDQILMKNNAYQLRVNTADETTANEFEWFIYDGSWTRCASGVVPTVGQWYHVAGTFDGFNLRIYVDGELKNTVADETAISTNDNPVQISYNGSFYGKIDEVVIWGWALTSDEIKERASLVGLWHFDNSGTTAQDATLYNNDGTFGGDPQWADGRIGKALDFDGDDYISISDSSSLDLTSDLTIEMWIKPSSTQKAYADILRKESGGNGYGIEMNGTADSNVYYFGWKNGGTPYGWSSGSFSLTADTWQHLAISKSGATRKVYVNGSEVASTTEASETIGVNDAALEIAAWSGIADREWKGTIDEVAIYNRALTADEIKSYGAPYENYKLRIYGKRGGDEEIVTASIWRSSDNTWVTVGDLPTSDGELTKSIAGEDIFDYLVGDNISIRYEAANDDDTQQTTIYIDQCVLEEWTTYETSIKFQVATSNNGTSWTGFMGPGGSTSVYFTASPASLTDIGDNQYIKYRAYFTSDDNTLTPTLGWVQICYTPPAGVGIEVTPTSHDFGLVSAGETKYTDDNHFAIKNTGGGGERFTISAGDATDGSSTWTLTSSDTPGAEQYALKYRGQDDSGWTFITSSPQTISDYTNVPVNETRKIDLKVIAPSSETSPNQFSFNVTIGAVQA